VLVDEGLACRALGQQVWPLPIGQDTRLAWGSGTWCPNLRLRLARQLNSQLAKRSRSITKKYSVAPTTEIRLFVDQLVVQAAASGVERARMRILLSVIGLWRGSK
jgi:hypothetical protein